MLDHSVMQQQYGDKLLHVQNVLSSIFILIAACHSQLPAFLACRQRFCSVSSSIARAQKT
jgi:hypothetical protein